MKQCAGLDWGSVPHAACGIDEQGALIAQLDLQPTTEGLQKLLTRLAPFRLPTTWPLPSNKLPLSST